MKKKIIFAILGVIIVGSIIYNLVKKEEANFTLFEVVQGNVIQEVLETGQVQTGKEINLGFKSSGTIQSIYAKVGDEVESGTYLVRLNTAELAIQLQEAEANLEVNQAKLSQLLAGSSAEEIKVAETTLANAQQALADTIAEAQEDLNQAYDDALVALDGSYAKGAAALTTITTVQQTYFLGNDQEATVVKAKKTAVEEALTQGKNYIDAAKADAIQANIDAALTKMKNTLNVIYDALVVIRGTTETVNYYNVVSSTSKTALDTEKTNVNTALTTLTNIQQTITSTKITNVKDINDAEGAVQKAQDELDLKKAGPRQADIDLYQAQVRQTQAQVDLLKNQIWDATLRSPVKGRVTAVNKKVGELVQPTLAEAVVTILPTEPYEIEVNIYEEDIVKMEVGNPVAITLIALPAQTFQGKVIAIDPAEELIEGVVYYKVTVAFEETPQGTKPGMTADIAIRTALRENVLIVPEDAVLGKDDRETVMVFQSNTTQEREITVGLRGSNEVVEVLSGLSEGEQIIVD